MGGKEVFFSFFGHIYPCKISHILKVCILYLTKWMQLDDLILNFCDTREHAGLFVNIFLSEYGDNIKKNTRFCWQCNEDSFPTLLYPGCYHETA